MTLFNEDDLANDAAWQSTADRAYALLGVPAVPVSASLRRRNPTDLSHLISNYDKLVVDGVSPDIKQPFHGQFVQVDVVDVAEAK